MRFLVLLSGEGHFDRWAASSDAERQEFLDRLRAFREAVSQRGTVLREEPLEHPSTRRRLTGPVGGERVVTAGPYAESVEQLNGAYLVELPDLATALELAGLLPTPVVDVLPVLALTEQS
ncbi:MAG TPA: YciI family protein [Nocardioides sp.]|nr:YciI family protein [Nocardioides sp.]